jgi:GntR family transcriptional repressor for pyruvate dehydrogenase complex
MAVTEDAIASIKAMIVSGELSPGMRLPPEKELSERLGLSRNSLREAVKSLEIIRVLDVRRGDGTYVTSLEPALLLEAMSFVVDLHQDRSVLEVFAVRRLLESHAAELAATRISADTIASLQASLAAATHSDDVEALVAHDIQFHRAISEASGNSYLAGMLDALSSATARARVWRGITEEGAVQRTLEEHSAILSALTTGDPDLARAAVVVHVAGIEAWLQKALPKTAE